jgi:hypothetical protein
MTKEEYQEEDAEVKDEEDKPADLRDNDEIDDAEEAFMEGYEEDAEEEEEEEETEEDFAK